VTATKDSVLRELAGHQPYRHDLFIALVAPLGSSRDLAIEALKNQVKNYGYQVVPIRLSDLLRGLPIHGGVRLPERTSPDYYRLRMDAGDRFRDQAGDDSALAALAVARVAAYREQRQQEKDEVPTVYVFDSLKHPREASLLRFVYGSGFWLVSLVQDPEERRRNLIDELSRQEGTASSVPEARAVELITRDEADVDSAHGQHVRDVFASADYFLAIRTGENWKAELARLIAGMFGDPFITPGVDEEAMRLAHVAALRSAAIGRQVGAVIVPRTGAPILTGTNEVPRPGGGQYWEGDSPDHRDFQTGSDSNPEFTERVLREVFERLAKANYFTKERNEAGGAAVLREAAQTDDQGKSILSGTRASSLIEFTRCLHAEQAAIVSAARVGVMVEGGKLYTTTFPCHECTKFIVGAGIVEVQYIEPYPKSLGSSLYRELIDALPPLQQVHHEDDTPSRIPFRGFLGFGPRRYDDVFLGGERRNGSQLVEHVPQTACPIGRDWNEVAIQNREDEVVLAIHAAIQRLSLASSSRSKRNVLSKDQLNEGTASA
jgi:deoxycytidylate deaminase